MKQHLWIAQLVRDIGFPSVVALILLVRAPVAIREAVSADTAVRKEAMIAALNTQAQAFAASAEQLKELTAEAKAIRMQASTVQGLIMGKYKCPPQRQCSSMHDVDSDARLAAAGGNRKKYRILLNTKTVNAAVERDRALDAAMENELAQPLPAVVALPVIQPAVPAVSTPRPAVRARRPYENGLPWER